MSDHPDATTFRTAMRLPATSVTVIAAGEGEERNGLTASAVCSLSDAPPMILACVNLNSSALPLIRARGCFSANFLTEAQHDLAERFAGRTRIYGAARFSDAGWSTLATGAPVLSTALAAFDCILEREHDSPTHAILIGRVVAITHDAECRSLVYSAGRFGVAQQLQTA